MRRLLVRRLCTPASVVPPASAITRATVQPGAVHVTWADGSESRFHHSWLRDHCPQSVHPISHQRELPLRHVSDAPPALLHMDAAKVELRWAATHEVSGKEHTSTYAAPWLFAHRYDAHIGAGTPASLPVGAVSMGPSHAAAPAMAPDTCAVRPWRPEEMADGAIPTVAWASLAASRQSTADSHALSALRHLRESGIVRVRGVPSTVEATEALAMQLGMVQPTFYGAIWDTAPRALADVIDTAYSNVELPLHNDCCYLEAQPGIQLFNCVEQPPAPLDEPHAGATKLADGFMAAQVLRRDFPLTFAYLCRVPVGFHHVEGGQHLVHHAPILKLHPATAEVVGIRYNDSDRAPFGAAAFDDVGDFYTHARLLEGVLEALEVPLRLECGDTILIDNHRVLHGRYAFKGHRNLIGCYMTADDWKSKLRVLEAKAAQA